MNELKKKSRLYLTAEMTGKPKLPPKGSIAFAELGVADVASLGTMRIAAGTFCCLRSELKAKPISARDSCATRRRSVLRRMRQRLAHC